MKETLPSCGGIQGHCSLHASQNEEEVRRTCTGALLWARPVSGTRAVPHLAVTDLSVPEPPLTRREVGECLAVDSEASTDPGERPLVRGLGMERSGGLEGVAVFWWHTPSAWEWRAFREEGSLAYVSLWC